MTQEKFDSAAIEAIYWWDRDEFFYHKSFSKIESIQKNSGAFEFFVDKIFKTFLREYSVRRNIGKGDESPKVFLEEIISYGFFNAALNGETNIIDNTSSYLSNKYNTNSTISLLSKIAFLVNPNTFTLYDTLAHHSVYNMVDKKQFKSYQLREYNVFIEAINALKMRYDSELTRSIQVLDKLIARDSTIYLKNNHDAFKLRILDKYLWLNSTAKKTNSDGYFEFLKIIKA